MSQNLEVKLARNTELAFTEAHLTFVTLYCSSGFSAGGGGSCHLQTLCRCDSNFSPLWCQPVHETFSLIFSLFSY